MVGKEGKGLEGGKINCLIQMWEKVRAKEMAQNQNPSIHSFSLIFRSAESNAFTNHNSFFFPSK